MRKLSEIKSDMEPIMILHFSKFWIYRNLISIFYVFFSYIFHMLYEYNKYVDRGCLFGTQVFPCGLVFDVSSEKVSGCARRYDRNVLFPLRFCGRFSI